MISVFLLFSACSRKKSETGANVKDVVAVDEMSPEEKEKLFRSAGVMLKENPTLADNLSRIETSQDEQGIRTDRYFYKNLPNLKYIEILTFANGQKQILIYAENGTVKSLSENTMGWLAKASPEEITGGEPAATEQQKENTSGGMKINTLPPIVIQTTPLPSQTIEEPKNEKPTEANTKTDAPTDKKDSRKETTSPNK